MLYTNNKSLSLIIHGNKRGFWNVSQLEREIFHKFPVNGYLYCLWIVNRVNCAYCNWINFNLILITCGNLLYTHENVLHTQITPVYQRLKILILRCLAAWAWDISRMGKFSWTNWCPFALHAMLITCRYSFVILKNHFDRYRVSQIFSFWDTSQLERGIFHI